MEKINFNNLGIGVNANARPMTSREILQEKIKFYNESIGHLNDKDGIECDKCKNKGYIMIEKYVEMYDDYSEFLTPCDCMKKRKIINNALRSGLGDYLKKRSKDYLVSSDWQEQNKQKMIHYCKEYSTNSTWFTILGQSGSGKTLMGSIIANHLLYNMEREVAYITWTDFISRLKRDLMSDLSSDVSEYLDYIKKVDVLFIDELLKKYNETDLKYIIEIINYRYQNDLKTIITSEHNIDSLLNIDEATFSRMLEKSENFVIDIPKDRSKNYRLKNIGK